MRRAGCDEPRALARLLLFAGLALVLSAAPDARADEFLFTGISLAAPGTDVNGNTCVSDGSSVMKLDRQGNLLWQAAFGPNVKSLAMDRQGNVYAARIEFTCWWCSWKWDTRVWTAKFPANCAGPTCAPEWTQSYGGYGWHSPVGLSAGPDGSVYLTMNVGSVRYSAAGEQLATAVFPGGWAQAMAVGDSGQVYVTGYTGVGGNDNDIVTIRYDFALNELSQTAYRRPGSWANGAVGIALDSSGRVYVGVESWADHAADYLLIKYDEALSLLATGVYDRGSGYTRDAPGGLAVSPQGEAVMTGISWAIEQIGQTQFFDTKVITVKFGPACAGQGCAPDWVHEFQAYRGPEFLGADARLALLGGYVYVAASSDGMTAHKLALDGGASVGVRRVAEAYPSAMSAGDGHVLIVGGASLLSGFLLKWDADPTVEPALAGVSDLAALLDFSGLPAGLRASLTSKLDEARLAIEGEDWSGLREKLNAFENEVLAQRGKEISQDVAAELLIGLAKARIAVPWI